MQFAEFERAAQELWQQIPEAYKAGIDALIVNDAALSEDEDAGVFTMGECVSEEYPSQYGGPGTIRSAVVLYYGSFVAVAEGDPDFDWDDEIYETVMHELKHHLEHLADEDSLVDYDYAVEENFKRRDGEPFDPGFYLYGEVVAEGMFLVEGDVFLHFASTKRVAMPIEFNWDEERYRVVLPPAERGVTYVRVDDGPDLGAGEFYVVRVVRRGTIDTLRAALAPQEEDTIAAVAVTTAQKVT